MLRAAGRCDAFHVVARVIDSAAQPKYSNLRSNIQRASPAHGHAVGLEAFFFFLHVSHLVERSRGEVPPWFLAKKINLRAAKRHRGVGKAYDSTTS